jgi:hypothetical protein
VVIRVSSEAPRVAAVRSPASTGSFASWTLPSGRSEHGVEPSSRWTDELLDERAEAPSDAGVDGTAHRVISLEHGAPRPRHELRNNFAELTDYPCAPA